MMGFCFVDYVPFGEVAMAPPSFSAKPKKAPVRSQVTVIYFLFLCSYHVMSANG